MLDYLMVFDGEDWQQRWDRTPLADGSVGSTDDVVQEVFTRCALGGDSKSPRSGQRADIRRGIQMLIALDVVRPRAAFLVPFVTPWLAAHLHVVRADPDYARVFADLDLSGFNGRSTKYVRRSWTRNRLAQLCAVTGKPIGGLAVDDLVAFAYDYSATGKHLSGVQEINSLLAKHGLIDGDYTARRKRLGRKNAAQFVSHYGVKSPTIARVLTAYLERRFITLDYSTQASVACTLVRNFWCVIEQLDPGCDTLAISEDVAEAWKEWLRHLRTPTGEPIRPRSAFLDEVATVRGMYLDIQEWAHEEPERWGQWAVRCPVSAIETKGAEKLRRLAKQRSHDRTRDRLPNVERLVNVAAHCYQQLTQMMAAASALDRGATFTHDGVTYRRTDAPGNDHLRVTQVSNDRKIDLVHAEESAFWGYAIVVLLRHTGLRIEELLEISQIAIRDYVHPDPVVGRVPLLHVAPSKNDKERCIVLEPEAVAVLGAILQRIRRVTGCGRNLPPIVGYDYHERRNLPPLPLIMRRTAGKGFKHGNTRPMTPAYVKIVIDQLNKEAAITDHAGRPVAYTPHDFRRIFATERQNSGDMPPHIIQALLGHANLTTTQGYAAVFPNDVIRAHSSWIAARRQTRADEYRASTQDEWDSFTENFMSRSIAIGTCMRQYESACDHEYACERCDLAQVDEDGVQRLRQTRTNVIDQVSEAETRGWRGEQEAKRAVLEAITRKINDFEAAQNRTRIVHLGIPAVR
ncbi:tyrosine-type recombinase/integrase [Flexivirga caeni]|uniref:tyrosine-type recombinase/integrase n=1 Tax=Flexivirga caeni TaxID=2294115 RepID=UPI0013152C64|nr:site-specific integrase [Flexivirga caeni]